MNRRKLLAFSAAFFSLSLAWTRGYAQPRGSRLEVFYLSAPDCPYCAHWESQSRAAFLASPEGKAVRFIEIRGRTLREPIDARYYPPEHRWVFEQIGPSRGVPRFLLAVEGKIVVSAYGTGEYTTKFLPALKQAVARSQMDKPQEQEKT